jgi:hypothetical protein
MSPKRLKLIFNLTKEHVAFLRQWTWFDAKKAQEFSAKGDAVGAGEWARSAAHDVLCSETLKGVFEW